MNIWIIPNLAWFCFFPSKLCTAVLLWCWGKWNSLRKFEIVQCFDTKEKPRTNDRVADCIILHSRWIWRNLWCSVHGLEFKQTEQMCNTCNRRTRTHKHTRAFYFETSTHRSTRKRNWGERQWTESRTRHLIHPTNMKPMKIEMTIDMTIYDRNPIQ